MSDTPRTKAAIFKYYDGREVVNPDDMAELERELAAVTAERELQRKSANEARCKIEALKNENRALHATVSARMMECIGDKNPHIEITKLEAEVARLKESAEKSDNAANAEVERLTKERDDLATKVERREITIEQLHDNVRHQRTERDEARTELAQIRNHRDELQRTLDHIYTTDGDYSQQLRAKVEKLTHERDKARTQVARLDTLRNIAVDSRDKAIKEVDWLRKERAELREVLEYAHNVGWTANAASKARAVLSRPAPITEGGGQ